MLSSVGFHRMFSPCARGATASGGVTLERAASSFVTKKRLSVLMCLCGHVSVGLEFTTEQTGLRFYQSQMARSVPASDLQVAGSIINK